MQIKLAWYVSLIQPSGSRLAQAQHLCCPVQLLDFSDVPFKSYDLDHKCSNILNQQLDHMSQHNYQWKNLISKKLQDRFKY